MDDKYSCIGGVIQVSVTNSSEDIYGKEWTKIPLNHLKYVYISFKKIIQIIQSIIILKIYQMLLTRIMNHY